MGQCQMYISSLQIKDLGPFKDLSLELANIRDGWQSNVTILIGINGSGKTSVLMAISALLSRFVSRMGGGKAIPMKDTAIRSKASFGQITLHVRDTDEKGIWCIFKDQRTRNIRPRPALMRGLLDRYRTALDENEDASLPLIAFYPVERAVLDIPLKIRTRHRFLQLDGYDNALHGGVDFRRFFEWFREREDAENESGLSEETFKSLERFARERSGLWKELSRLQASARDRQLTAVRTAISRFMPGFTNLKVQRKPRLRMVVTKGSETLNVSQLSQGEKSLMALVGDIARRLAMMNPGLENPLEGEGVVLIDEIELHLHPAWQRKIVGLLKQTFPNVQFVLSTHSPLVISDEPDVLVYAIENAEVRQVENLFGEDVNSVLGGTMKTPIRNRKISKRISDVLDLIHDKDIETAKRALQALEQDLPDGNIEVAKARMLMRKQELKCAQNS